jgi:hypothetical protein
MPNNSAAPPPSAAPHSKLDRLTTLLVREEGADLATMMAATGWQAHSVRGALAGSLKKRGLVITSAKTAGGRVWRAQVSA